MKAKQITPVYQIRADHEEKWTTVSKEYWMKVEKNCGFHSKVKGEPATGGFGNEVIRGRISLNGSTT